MIAASVNTIEFALRENNTGRFPRGLALFMRALGTWLHDRDPLAPLAFEAPLAAVKSAPGGRTRTTCKPSFAATCWTTPIA
jgi:Zn-dependent M16 (insulinase) family peptidase